jgi:hypothetical protein
MNIPYKTKSGVQIGKYYQKPKYVEEDTDMLRLQSYLIYDPARLKRQYWINKFVMFLSVVTLLVVIIKS